MDDEQVDPYVRGWRDALSEARKCGAYNAEHPPPRYSLCVREAGHTGKHDDGWTPWGDRAASATQNRAEAAREWRTPR